MRPLAIILLLASAVVLHAQEQERKLVDRIMKPDTSMSDPIQFKTFNPGGGGSVDLTKSANVKEFYFTQKFSPKSFETKQFEAKNYWGGDFQFATKAANVKSASESDKKYETKAVEVKDATETDKNYDTKTYATREAMERGKTSQNHLDEQNKGASSMNMDQVRELLNKNK